jgi:glycosyltransferase involved in cell wall biosynthesis
LITLMHTESSLGWGGQEMRIMREMRALDRNTFLPLLGCQPESQIAPKAKELGVGVDLVKIRGNIDPLAILQLIRVFRRRGVDIVHTHSNADSWNASIAARFTSPRPWVVRTRHLSAAFNNRLIYSLMADRVITTGEYTRKYMIREKGIDPDRVVAIPSGIDLDRFNPETTREDIREELGLAKDTLVFGSASVFRKKKGYHFLLQATPQILSVYPSSRLLLAGGGPQEHNLRRQIEELKIQGAVILPGFRNDMPRVLNTMDVFVFPTLEEAFPNAVMEALAMKRAVVASRVGGVPDIIRDGETGYLMNPGDPSAIAEKVSDLLKNEEVRQKVGIRGRRFVEENCSHRIMVRRIEELYRSLMDKGRA